MERIGLRLTRSNGPEFAGVNELTEHSQSGAGPANRRLLRIQKKIHTRLHRCSAPYVHVRRLIATGNPECLSVLYMAADIRRVCTGHRGDNDGLYRIHLRTELLNIRIVRVCASGPDHNEVATACLL